MFLHLAAREAGSEPIAPEHLLIVFLDRLDLSLLESIGITADAVRDVIGHVKKGPPKPISMIDKVVFNVDNLDELEFADDLHSLFHTIYALEEQKPISKDVLVKGLLSHLNNDPSFRMQSLLAEVIDRNHDIDGKIQEFMEKKSGELGENGEEFDLDNLGLDCDFNNPTTRSSFDGPSNDPDNEKFYDAVETLDQNSKLPQPDYSPTITLFDQVRKMWRCCLSRERNAEQCCR